MPDSGVRVVQVGTIDWLNQWVGHGRPGARQMIGPVAMTHTITDGLGKRVQALVEAGLIIATWKAVAPVGSDARWEWRLIRTGRDLPAAWPMLPKQGVASCATLTAKPMPRAQRADALMQVIVAAAVAGLRAPSTAEMAAKLGGCSPSTAQSLLDELERDGRIVVRRTCTATGSGRVIRVPALDAETAMVAA